MKLDVRETDPSDAPAIAEFLAATFGLPPSHPMLDPRQLYWRYWTPMPEWKASRSVVMTRDGEIVAHAGVVYGTLLCDSARLRVAHLIDWSARRDVVGAGRALLMRVRRQTDALIAVGGSAETRALLPVLGFDAIGTATIFVRPLHPWQRVALAPRASWRLGPQFVRSAMWALMARTAVTGDWSAKQLDRVGLGHSHLPLPLARAGRCAMGRTSALFDHALQCPMTPMSLYAVADGQRRTRGYFLLAFAPGQVRLGDCWIDSDEPAAWNSLVGLAVGVARAVESAAEMVAWSSESPMSASLIANGFHRRSRAPIHLMGDSETRTRTQSLRIQMLDNDAIWNHAGVPEFEA